MSERVVTYEGHELHLTVEEYSVLWRTGFIDPAEAERMALGFLHRELTCSCASGRGIRDCRQHSMTSSGGVS